MVLVGVAVRAMSAISLFSGGGGFDLGVAEAGFRTRVAVEYEKFACATLRKNQALKKKISDFGHSYLDGCTIIERDIRAVSSGDILQAAHSVPGEIDLLVGGPPCITFSYAGKREGLCSATGLLYEEYIRVLRDTMPRAFIFENVKGMVTAVDEHGQAGTAFAKILSSLEESGYAITWRVVDAADYGVPQHRQRVIILGRRGPEPFTFPVPTHYDPQQVSLFTRGALARWRTVRDAIGWLPPAVPHGSTPAVPNHVARTYTPAVIASLAATPPGKRNPMYKRDRLEWDKPAKTIRAQGKPKSNGSGQKNSSHQSIHPDEHRQLTVRESACIQSFPCWYIFDETFVNGYRVVGDAVPPMLARVLAEAVRDQLTADEVGGTFPSARE